MEKINLVSTALVADWTKKGVLICTPLTSDEFAEVIINANEVVNFCGHPATTKLLKDSGLAIPDQLLQYNADGSTKINLQGGSQGAFWNGQGIAVAARPKGGVRASTATGDTLVSSLNQLEFLQFEFLID